MILTSGALAKICAGQEVIDPVLQVLAFRPIYGSYQERYRLCLNDGKFYNSFIMLGTHLNNLIYDREISPYSIIKVKKQVCNSVNEAKKIVVLLEVEVLKPGHEVGEKIGSPVVLHEGGFRGFTRSS